MGLPKTQAVKVWIVLLTVCYSFAIEANAYGQTARDYFRRAHVYKAEGHTQRAIELYRKALAVEPTSQDAATGLFSLFYEQGRIKEGLSVLESAIRANKKAGYSPAVIQTLYLGTYAKGIEAMTKDGDYDGALAAYRMLTYKADAGIVNKNHWAYRGSGVFIYQHMAKDLCLAGDREGVKAAIERIKEISTRPEKDTYGANRMLEIGCPP